MIQRAKIEVFGYFLEFGWSDVLHTGYFDCTNNWAIISLMQDHSKLAKMYFWMIQRAKIEVFGHFLEFGWSDVLHTAYFDCTKWSFQLGINIAHAGSFNNHKSVFLNDPKIQNRGLRPFSGVWSVLLTWYCILWFYSMFHNFRQCYQILRDHSEAAKMHFWMVQRAKKEGFGHFLEFGLLDRLDIAYCDST